MKTKTTAATSVPASRARAHLTAAPYLCIRYTKIYSACLSIFHLKKHSDSSPCSTGFNNTERLESIWHIYGQVMDIRIWENCESEQSNRYAGRHVSNTQFLL